VQFLEQFRRDIEATYENMYRELDQSRASWLYFVDDLTAKLSQSIESVRQETYANGYLKGYKPSSHLAN
jgi:hypothetical protein